MVQPFFVSPPEIVTERLELRALRTDDAQAIYDYASKEIVTKYVLFPTHQSIADTEQFISRAMNESPTEFGIVWAIVLKDSGKLIGTIGLHHADLVANKVEVGYAMHEDYWGKGYTTEAVLAVIDEVFRTTEINRIEAHYVAEHSASGRVMEKAGMQYEGTFRDAKRMKTGLCDMKVYSILKREWESSRNG
jgi:ribosomal-protein-alanine N-acetyltransferase